MKRFKERQKIEFKRFKITEEDWRNREKWNAYQQAICDMVDHTSTGTAPWTLVEANDKGYARVKILRTLCQRIEAELEGKAIPTEKPEKPAKADKGDKSGKDRKADNKPSPASPAPLVKAATRSPKPARPRAPPAARTVRQKKGKTAT